MSNTTIEIADIERDALKLDALSSAIAVRVWTDRRATALAKGDTPAVELAENRMLSAYGAYRLTLRSLGVGIGQLVDELAAL